MRKRIGAMVLAVFAVVGVAAPIAQVAIPCPAYCDPKNLQAEYGDDWHLYYALFGCWLISPPCGAASNLAGIPSAAMVRPVLAVR